MSAVRQNDADASASSNGVPHPASIQAVSIREEEEEDEAETEGEQQLEYSPHSHAHTESSAVSSLKRRGPMVSFHEPDSSMNEELSSASSTADEAAHNLRIPAAGLGTRTKPRRTPRSSSSLRHVTTSRARTSSLSQPLPEDRDLSIDSNYSDDPSASLVARQVNVEKRRAERQRRQDAALLADFDDDDEEYEQRSEDSIEEGVAARRVRNAEAVGAADEYDYFSRSGSTYDKAKSKASVPHQANGGSSTLNWSSASASDDSDDWDGEGPSLLPVGVATTARALAPPLDPIDSLHDLHNGVSATPGPSFPLDLHTPADLGEHETPILNPRHRLEWQSMLESVLNSEVLKSETKRINSVDTPDLSRQQLGYQRWLDIRATLRGRGSQRGAVDEEETRLKEGFGQMLKDLVQEIRDCRAEQIALADKGSGQTSSVPSSSPASQGARADGGGGDSPFKEGTSDSDSPRPENPDSDPEAASILAEKDKILVDIGSLLGRIDSAEEQFPSNKRAVEIVPEWGDAEVQAKLGAIYCWYNTTTSLRLQIEILRKWTGSDTLEITAHRATRDDDDERDKRKQQRPGQATADEDSTFVERIQKEGSLQSTFEKRTLASLYQLINKSKDTILKYNKEFARMGLPPFEPELITLISFPTRLMEGALRFRLDYAGKLAEPSVLIVDSLTDDLRSALAMACRVKLHYTSTIVGDPERGWNLSPCIAEGYDDVLRSALKFFFKLLRLKLKASLYFKETEILEPEWRFLSTAVESIEGGDIIVATNITRFVNKLFDRIARYFNRELNATMTQQDQHGRRLPSSASGPVGLAKTDQAGPGARPHGKNFITLEDRAKWIHSVFDSVRIRSRKLLGFARDIRNRLDNAAEYDLGSLRSSSDYLEADDRSVAEYSEPAAHGGMTLSSFMLKLIDHGYFLVYTESLEENGIYLVAEPSLQDKPDLIQELVCKCLHRVRPGEEDSAMAAEATAAAFNPDGEEGEETTGAAGIGNANALREQLEKQTNSGGIRGSSTKADDDAHERPHYILLLSPRDPFMWTGKVMHHIMPRVDIALADRRVRLIADGPKRRLELAKRHFQSIFEYDGAGGGGRDGSEDGQGGFPLETLNDQMAHMSRVQSGLEDINKGVYMLSDTIIRKVPEIRRRLRGFGVRASAKGGTPRSTTADATMEGLSGNCDELIQNCYSMAAEHGRRALPFIESARLRDQMTLALGRLAIDWIAFICDDCVPSERKTFKWAVTALGNANHITSTENIFRLNEHDFALLRAKVASCMALLISHFDILGARSSVAKAEQERERSEREKAERNRITAGSSENVKNLVDDFEQLRLQSSGGAVSMLEKARSALAGPGIGAQNLFNKLDAAMQATEERWISKMLEWDAARNELDVEQRLIGRVLDDTRLEDRSLQFLAQSASKITIRWQQGQFIGGGTFGTVYLAVNLDSGGLMAVKEIRFQDISSTPSLYQQIKDEMEVMSMLSHPNIVEYYGIEVHRDRVYIFEEYCQGGSLAALLEHGRIEDETVIQVYTLQMLEGLIYLHSQGIIHRDIKPDNILLDHMGVLKYVDFGAAKILAKNSRTIQRSRKTGGMGNIGMLAQGAAEGGKQGGPAGAMASLQGTPMYMSPEVIKGNSDGHQSAADIWSLGCVVLEFATGKRPWSNFDNEWAIMFHIGMAEQHPALPDPSQLSPMGIEFIRQCLTISPRQRPSAIQLKEDPWMRSLIEELDAANEAEAAAELAGVPVGGLLPGEAGYEEMGSSSSGSSVSNSLEGGHHPTGAPQTPGGPSSLFKSLDRNVSSLNSMRSRWSNSEAGGPPGSSSSGGTGVTTPYNPSMSLRASLGFRQQQQAQQKMDKQGQRIEEESPQQEGDPDGDGAGLEVERPLHVPGHPNHSHPGSSAIVADLQYQKEEAQRVAMLRNDSELSALPDEP